ncbi:actin [Diplonema papillatum]|nr:actin [Diplonema papillatum]
MKRKHATNSSEEDLTPFASTVFELGGSKVVAGHSGAVAPEICIPADFCRLPDGTREFRSDRMVLPPLNACVDSIWPHHSAGEGASEYVFAPEAAWDMMDTLLRKLRAAEKPVVLVDPPGMLQKDRTALVDRLFNSSGVPAVAVAQDAPCYLYAAGKEMGLVVDVGYRGTRVVGVYDGFALNSSAVSSQCGAGLAAANWGAFLSWKQNERHHTGVEDLSGTAVAGSVCIPPNRRPTCNPILSELQVIRKLVAGDMKVFNNPMSSDLSPEEQRRLATLQGADPSFHEASRKRTLHQAVVGLTTATPASSQKVQWELPDGTQLSISDKDRLVLGGPCFTDKPAQDVLKHPFASHLAYPKFPVPALIRDCLLRLEPSLRSVLRDTLLLKGGMTVMPGFVSRLQDELCRDTPHVPVTTFPSVLSGALRQKGMPLQTVTDYSSWLGGSILASTASYIPHFISKVEWDEIGPAILDTKTF